MLEVCKAPSLTRRQLSLFGHFAIAAENDPLAVGRKSDVRVESRSVLISQFFGRLLAVGINHRQVAIGLLIHQPEGDLAAIGRPRGSVAEPAAINLLWLGGLVAQRGAIDYAIVGTLGVGDEADFLSVGRRIDA